MIRIIFDNLQSVKSQLQKNTTVQFTIRDPSISTIRALFKLSSENNVDPSIKFSESISSQDIFWNSYRHVCLGGTFDHLHPGHKLLLTEAAHLASEKITIGIAHDDLLKNKSLKEFIQSYSIREKSVKNYLDSISKNQLEIDIQPIQDPVGPAGTIVDLDAIVLSEETVSGGEYAGLVGYVEFQIFTQYHDFHLRLTPRFYSAYF